MKTLFAFAVSLLSVNALCTNVAFVSSKAQVSQSSVVKDGKKPVRPELTSLFMSGKEQRGSMDVSLDRREWIKSAAVVGAAVATSTIVPSAANAEQTKSINALLSTPSSADLENGLLESRVTENLMNPPPYGLESPDIFYPSFFTGVWDVVSTTKSVEAPCGPQLFGGNRTFASAQKEIGLENSLYYKSRFVPNGNGQVVADREFNVREIAKATMGTNSVVDVSLATPNKFSCLLSPMGAPSILAVDILALNRRQEKVDDRTFDCSEVVRQIVVPVEEKVKPQTAIGTGSSASRTTLLKEIETISLYTASKQQTTTDGNPIVTEIQCKQRSATFLLPSQQDPIAYQLWQMTRGRPIDVRFYDVTYTKRT